MAELNPYRYASYRYDENTKLYYLMARYYNPDNGVFLSIDPVRGELQNPITLNGYNYANNNPVMSVDPDGQYVRIGIVVLALVSKLYKNTKKSKSTSKPLKMNLQYFSKGKSWVKMTTKQATKAAKELDYSPTNKYSKKEMIFYNKKTKTYITQDVGSGDGSGPHNGGVWKMAKSAEALGSKGTRMGTECLFPVLETNMKFKTFTFV